MGKPPPPLPRLPNSPSQPVLHAPLASPEPSTILLGICNEEECDLPLPPPPPLVSNESPIYDYGTISYQSLSNANPLPTTYTHYDVPITIGQSVVTESSDTITINESVSTLTSEDLTPKLYYASDSFNIARRNKQQQQCHIYAKPNFYGQLLAMGEEDELEELSDSDMKSTEAEGIYGDFHMFKSKTMRKSNTFHMSPIEPSTGVVLKESSKNNSFSSIRYRSRRNVSYLSMRIRRLYRANKSEGQLNLASGSCSNTNIGHFKYKQSSSKLSLFDSSAKLFRLKHLHGMIPTGSVSNLKDKITFVFNRALGGIGRKTDNVLKNDENTVEENISSPSASGQFHHSYSMDNCSLASFDRKGGTCRRSHSLAGIKKQRPLSLVYRDFVRQNQTTATTSTSATIDSPRSEVVVS